jgi:hypothetical protein
VSQRQATTRRRLFRVAVQVVGLAAGAMSLWWCISTAFQERNRHQLELLAHAPGRLIAALAALCFGTLIVNGLIFWVTLLPVRRLRAVDVLATNALCTFLGYVPLKAGAILRVLIHNRRDHVPLPTIGAWLAAILVAMAIAMGPAILATTWRGQIDEVWIAAVGGMMAIGIALTVWISRAFRGPTGLERLTRLLGPLGLRRILATRFWSQLHSGFDMLASPGALTVGVLLRLTDLGIHAGRFLVAARILDVPLAAAQAIPIAIAYFVIGVISPSGLIGFRESGAAVTFGALFAAAGLTTGEASEQFAAVSLLVTAVEAATFLAGGALGLAWLRPDRLIRLRAKESANPAEPPP